MEIEKLRETIKDKLLKKNVSLDKKVGRGKYQLTCKNCNTIFYVTESNLLHHGFSCPKCYLPKYNIDIFKDKVKDMYGDEYTVISKDYVNSKTKIEMKHNTCGNIYSVTPNKFLIGRKCPKCSHGSSLKTQEEYENDVFNAVGEEYTVLGKYMGANKKIKLKHNICGNEYETNAVSILSGCRCPKCSHSNILKTQEEVKEEISETDPTYELASEYKGSKIPITLKHLTCGCEFTTTLRNFTHEFVRCPNCKDYNTSKFEIEIREFIESIYPGVVLHNTKLDKKEMDIYIPDKKLCIEADGLYWHSVQKHDNKLNLLDKTKFFNDKDIRVVHIFEDEWANKKDIVKDKLISIIGCDTNKIYARKCSLVIPDDKKVNVFLNEHHIQGCGSASYKVGLEYNNELVAVMTFTKLRKSVTNQKDDSAVELFRFATKGHVVGAFSKLLKHAIKTFNFTSIVTFADLRWSDQSSNVYLKNRFKLDHISEPSYWYFKGLNRIHRSSFMKYKLKDKLPEFYDDNLTEKQIMEKAGYKYIYDCGNMVFKLEIKD